ncbi:MAG TPA: hypothetical protein VHW01_10760 [Polyangiaceae bacterium]|nr:hypothetical protein [Polyangiaceae bacterium]
MRRQLAWLVVLGLADCSSRRLPAGTPAPEYEPPVIAAWTADASTDAGPAPSDAPRPAELRPGPELSPDAGVR